jgi:hypothetical protein
VPRFSVPEDGTAFAGRRGRPADDLVVFVDRAGSASASAERAEVGHLPVLPNEGVPSGWLARQAAPTDYLTLIVDRGGAARRPAERAQRRLLPR